MEKTQSTKRYELYEVYGFLFQNCNVFRNFSTSTLIKFPALSSIKSFSSQKTLGKVNFYGYKSVVS